jgi:hypothetical protein
MNHYSPYAQFHLALQGWIVYDKKGRKLQKVALWDRHKHNESETEEIKTRQHIRYSFVRNLDYDRLMRKTNTQKMKDSEKAQRLQERRG